MTTLTIKQRAELKALAEKAAQYDPTYHSAGFSDAARRAVLPLIYEIERLEAKLKHVQDVIAPGLSASLDAAEAGIRKTRESLAL